MNIKTIYGVVNEEQIEIKPYGCGSYTVCYIKTHQQGDYYLLGFDAPMDDDNVWRFWIESGFKDGSAETDIADITDAEKKFIKSLYQKYKGI